jgi:hypothetical protein
LVIKTPLQKPIPNPSFSPLLNHFGSIKVYVLARMEDR